MAWSPSRAYARQKAFYVATLVLWSLVACALIIAPERQRLRRFVASTLVFALFAAGQGAVASFQAGHFQHIVKGIGGNYLGMQRVIGPGMLIVLAYLFFTTRERASRKLVALIVLAFMGFAMLTLGGRGPVVATVLAALVPFFVGIRLRPTPFLGRVTVRRYVVPLAALVVIAVAAVTLLIAVGFSSATLTRFSDLVASGSLALTDERFELYSDALLLWQQSPFVGRGIGAYPVLEGWPDAKGYPHNLIFETLAELGLVGVVLLGTIHLVALRALGSLRSIRGDPWRILVLMLFVNAFLNAMLTEDIVGNRLVFAILGLMVMARQEIRAPSPASTEQHD
jgi:O-antigen ligase